MTIQEINNKIEDLHVEVRRLAREKYSNITDLHLYNPRDIANIEMEIALLSIKKKELLGII